MVTTCVPTLQDLGLRVTRKPRKPPHRLRPMPVVMTLIVLMPVLELELELELMPKRVLVLALVLVVGLGPGQGLGLNLAMVAPQAPRESKLGHKVPPHAHRRQGHAAIGLLAEMSSTRRTC